MQALLVFVAACENGTNGISIVGDSADVAAQKIADALCTRQQQCGVWSIDCMRQPDGKQMCTGHISASDPRTDCQGKTLAAWEMNLMCAMPVSSEMMQVQTCVNDTVELPCVSQSQLDEAANQLEAGHNPDPHFGTAPSCLALAPIFADCPQN